MIDRKMKRIILLVFKRTSDTSERYYYDMKEVSVTQYTPILILILKKGLNALAEDRGWEPNITVSCLPPLSALSEQRRPQSVLSP
jgi:hypothetical protein